MSCGAGERWAALPSTGVKIAAVAHALPAQVVTNQDVIDAYRLRLKAAWVREALGIEERRWCQSGEAASGLAAEVCERLLAAADLAPAAIDRLLLATVSPDLATPATACIAQSLFAPGATFPCLDLVAACSGFVYALDLARRGVQTGDRHALCVAAEVRSAFLDMRDRRTVMLFGDGAAGVLLAPCQPGEVGIISTQTWADGRGWEAITAPRGGVITMRDGAALLERAVAEMTQLTRDALAPHGLTPADPQLLLFHQASGVIVDRVCQRLGVAPERTWRNFHRLGNTTAASLPLTLAEAAAAGRLTRGDLVVLVATGGGFTAGSALLRWEVD